MPGLLKGKSKVSWEVGISSDSGGRKVNEDTAQSAKSRDGALCLVVADGLGGHGGGDQASKAAAQCICEGFTAQTGLEELRGLILEANSRILSLQTKQCEMKTTAVVLIINKDHMVRAHVGDSRLYHFIDGNLVFQTRDHSVAQMSVVLGDISPDEIRFNEDRSKVLRALGQDGNLNVEMREEDLRAGRHAFLLCTDGFWEYVLEDEMEETLRAAANPDDWIARMRSCLSERVNELCGDDPCNDNNTAAAAFVTVKK